MSITVRYFASLREQMGREQQMVGFEPGDRVADIWARAAGGVPWPDNMLCAVNLEQASAGSAVSDGDEVAFFPPVTGG